MGGRPLEFINIQRKKGGPPLKVIKLTSVTKKSVPSAVVNSYTLLRLVYFSLKQTLQPPKRGSASRIHQRQPKNGSSPLGTISMDLAVYF